MLEKERLKQLIEKGNAVLNTHYHVEGTFGFPTLNSGKFEAWKTQVLSYLSSHLPAENQYFIHFKEQVKRGYQSSAEQGIGILQSVLEDFELGLLDIKSNEIINNPSNSLEKLFEKFHLVVRQMRNCYSSRPTLDVADEYDVQDLLHSLLILDFEDIRAEEWTPSYAGKCCRMDFLLKDFKIVIEVKKSRRSLNASQIGSELIEDIGRYSIHPDCETLVCFVYDPEGYVSNPRGLEKDLSRTESNMAVRVFIRP
jgi:hypothetical protein